MLGVIQANRGVKFKCRLVGPHPGMCWVPAVDTGVGREETWGSRGRRAFPWVFT